MCQMNRSTTAMTIITQHENRTKLDGFNNRYIITGTATDIIPANMADKTLMLCLTTVTCDFHSNTGR